MSSWRLTLALILLIGMLTSFYIIHEVRGEIILDQHLEPEEPTGSTSFLYGERFGQSFRPSLGVLCYVELWMMEADGGSVSLFSLFIREGSINGAIITEVENVTMTRPWTVFDFPDIDVTIDGLYVIEVALISTDGNPLWASAWSPFGDQYARGDGYRDGWRYTSDWLFRTYGKPDPHPDAEFAWNPSIPRPGESVTFNASSSVPNGGTITNYQWYLGDGNYTTGKVTNHTYSKPGVYMVMLNVTDSEGFWDSELEHILISDVSFGPVWRFQGQSDGLIGRGRDIVLFGQTGGKCYLNYAWLSTNESGSWVNHTIFTNLLDNGDLEMKGGTIRPERPWLGPDIQRDSRYPIQGNYSLLLDKSVGGRYAYQTVPVQENTEYIIHMESCIADNGTGYQLGSVIVFNGNEKIYSRTSGFGALGFHPRRTDEFVWNSTYNTHLVLNITFSGPASVVFDNIRVLGPRYGSPKCFNRATNWSWSNFTWHNWFSYDGAVAWKIYYNNTSGDVNATSVKVFRVFRFNVVGDITGPIFNWPDGKCDMRDVGLVARHFMQTSPPAPGDITGPVLGVPDGLVDMRDIGLVASHFGETGIAPNY